MPSRIIKQVVNILEKRDIDYERNYITFEHNNKHYQVFRLSRNKTLYRLNIIDGGQCYSQDYNHARINDMFSRLIRSLDEVNENDDSNIKTIRKYQR